jgi:hypothetical protein
MFGLGVTGQFDELLHGLTFGGRLGPIKAILTIMRLTLTPLTCLAFLVAAPFSSAVHERGGPLPVIRTLILATRRKKTC